MKIKLALILALLLMLAVVWYQVVYGKTEIITAIAKPTEIECFLKTHPNCKVVGKLGDLVKIECEVK